MSVSLSVSQISCYPTHGDANFRDVPISVPRPAVNDDPWPSIDGSDVTNTTYAQA